MDNYESSLPLDLSDRLNAELYENEKLIWSGQPRLDLATRPAYILVPFGIVFLTFALIWMVMAAFITFGIMAPCGLPFVAVGIALMASPVWLRSRAKRTLYALTDRRAIVWEPGWFGSNTVRNYTSAGLGRIARTERSDGSGDLVFEELTTYSHNHNGGTYHTTRRGFMGIDDVRDVEELVQRTLLNK